MSDESQNLPAVVPAPLAMLPDAEVPSAVCWAIAEIAAEGYTPVRGRYWAGRSKIVTRVGDEYGVTPEEAERLVDLAVQDLCTPRRDDEKMVRVRLLESRLMSYRALVLGYLNSGNKNREMVHEWVPVLDKNRAPVLEQLKNRPDGEMGVVVVKSPKREHVTTGLDIMALRWLLELEELLANIHRLADDASSQDKMAQILETLEKTSKFQDAETGEEVTHTLTVAQQTKLRQMKDLGPSGREVLERALRAAKRKKVHSRDVTGGSVNGEEIQQAGGGDHRANPGGGVSSDVLRSGDGEAAD